MFIPFLLDTTDLYIHYITAKCKSQENAVLIAIHPTTYRRGGFLAHGVLNEDFSKPNAVYLYENENKKMKRRIMLNDTWERDYIDYVECNPMTLWGW